MDTIAPVCKVESCVIPVDIVLQSSEGDRFGAHTKNLECFSEGFPPVGWTQKSNEVVVLTEKSTVLSLLLAFMHNSTFPDLEDDQVNIDDLLLLCEAAEKYGNFIALQACRKAFKSRAKNMDPHALLKVLRYKVCRSDITDINDFARRTAGISMKEVWSFSKGYPEVYYIWSRYQMAWAEWDLVFEYAMDINSYETNHRDTRQCPDLNNYLDYLKNSRKIDGAYATWDIFNNHRMLLNELLGLKSFCGCGAFSKWLANIQTTFECQPKWEDYAG
ncbi:hypothetical protein L218DRAFT_909485 [Marasmius fiardii PR-910]|nr:hypothetical protein L218DRAFT_909485 [Marasmius fiardii PR-910]